MIGGVRVQEVAARWGLALGPAYSGNWNLVHRVTLPDGRDGVLKVVAHPGVDLAREAAALRAWGGDGAVRLLRSEAGALLLERLDPGTTLVDLVDADDDQATRILAGVAARLHAASPSGVALPALESRRAAFAGYRERHPADDGPVPTELVARADALIAALSASAGRVVVLHGDLHHENVVLDRDRGRLAIDPHGLVGDPGYEFGALLYNPLRPDREPGRAASVLGRLPRRLDVLAEVTGLDRDRLVAWGFVQAVLSQVWSDEEGVAGLASAVQVARALETRLRV